MSILVTANTRPARGSLAALDRQMAYSIKRSSAGAVALQRAATGLKFAGVGLAAGLAGSVAAAISFEQEFANVKKTVQASPSEFKKVRKGILDLTSVIPSSANELADLAGEAGALGVEAPKLKAFTRIAAELGTATDLSATAAADDLARLGNIMQQRTIPDFQHMGSTLVALGNKGASTESEIAAMALRIAGAGKQVGLTSAQVLGLGAALANVGIQSQMGGSAISRVMLAMQSAIAVNGDELKVWAQTAGMTTKQFADAFKKDPTVAIANFAEGLGKVSKGGGDLASVLTQLGVAAHTSMNEIRVRDTLLRIAGNTDAFTKSMNQSNQAWDKNNALQQEFSRRQHTLASQLDLLKNDIVRVGIGIGTSLMPNIRDMVQILRDPKLTLAQKVEGAMGEVQDILQQAIPMMAEIGGKMGLALATGLFKAFGTSSPLAKMFEFAAFIRFVGGPGALRALGMKLGGFVGSGVAAGTAESMAVGGAAGGAASGLTFIGAEAGASKLTRLKAGAFAFGKATLGLALGYGVISGLSSTLTEPNADRSVMGVLQDFSVNTFRSFGINLGNTTADDFQQGFDQGMLKLTQSDFSSQPMTTNAMIDAARAKATQQLSGMTGKSLEMGSLGVPSPDAVSKRMAEILKKSAQKMPSARDIFGTEIWDKMAPDKQQLAQQIRRSMIGAGKLLQHEHIDLPKNLIQTDPKGTKALEQQLDQSFNVLRSGALRGMQDINTVVQKDQQRINKELGANTKAGQQATAQLLRAQAQSIGKWMKESGNVTKAGLDHIQALIEQANVIDAGGKQARGFAKEWSKGIDTTKTATDKGLDAVMARIDKMPKDVQDIAVKTMLKQLAVQHQQNKLSDDAYKKLVSHTLAHYSELSDRSQSKTAGMAKGVMNIVGGLVDTVSGSGGFGTLVKNVNSALSAFGVSGKSGQVHFSITKAAKAAGSFLGQFGQRGGPLTGGAPQGDTIPLMAERDEYLVNQKASRKHRPLLDAINFADAPRFAKGGSVTGDTQGLVPPFMSALSQMSGAAHTPISVTSGFRTFAEQVVLYNRYLAGGTLAAVPGTSEHEKGIAADISPGSEVFGGIAGKFGLGFDVAGEPWHIALLGAAAGGMMGATWKNIARLILKGPKGGARSAGQGALDKAWKAANAYGRKQAAKMGGGGSFPTGPGVLSKQEMKGLMKAHGMPDIFGWIALAESGFNPAALNPSGASGLWQIMMPLNQGVVHGNVFDPNVNADAAMALAAPNGSNLAPWAASQGTWGSHVGQPFRRGGTVMPPYGGGFRDGGVVPGPRGAARTIVAHGGEQVSGAGQKRYAITITNWKKGTGYMEEIADNAVNGQRRLGNQLSRMSRA